MADTPTPTTPDSRKRKFNSYTVIYDSDFRAITAQNLTTDMLKFSEGTFAGFG